MTTIDEPAGELVVSHARFRDELLDAGLLVDAGAPGLYGRSGEFEDIVDGLQYALARAVAPENAERLTFAPIYPRQEFDETDYVASFPQLTGTISTFTGGDSDHAALLTARAEGKSWDSWLSPAETVLVPAVCHPLYARLQGKSLPPEGRVFDVTGYVFRHEPSIDPMRMQVFRQHEYIFVGGQDAARDFRDTMLDATFALLIELGLGAQVVAANDPFFGRAGRMLASNQRRSELKLEIVTRIYGDHNDGTAIGSGNCHEDHFGDAFNIMANDGSVAHSACIGAGLERITLALLRRHGLDSSTWPDDVRARLGWRA